MPRHFAGLMVALGLGMLVGCFVKADSHCANNGGNSYCAAEGLGSFCDACTGENNGCVESMSDIENPGDCYFPDDGTDTGTSTSGDDGSSGDDGTVPDDGGTDDGSSDDGSADDGGSTGTSDGGSTGTTDTTDTTGTPPECDAPNGEPDPDDCTNAETPFCDEGVCVDCSDAPSPDTSCAALGTGTDYCDTDANECVACTSHDHCTDEHNARCDDSSHTCVPCQANPECSNIPNQNVCNNGDCVECTPQQDSACGGDVCHAIDNICTGNAPGSAGDCEECVADYHCVAGQLCIPMTFNATPVGNYCLWERDAPDGPDGSCSTPTNRPYVVATTETSIEGVTEMVCTLDLTTCPALKDYRETSCTAGDDDACGVDGLADGYCRLFEDPDTYRCTIPCLSSDDCPSPKTCNNGATPDYCNF